ncbi:MAG: hypothetical protein HZC54_10965 [Verrucomicrobia bacterium]|nr:hypothetical protein [Verrucomicrobiota bacterium]
MKARCLVCHDPAQAEQHPDWQQRDVAGQPRRTLCLNSPYVAKVLWPWMTHAAGDPACDALEFEISAEAGEPCWCDACALHLKEAGLDLNDPAVRKRFALDSVARFRKETAAYAEAVRPGLKVRFT